MLLTFFVLFLALSAVPTVAVPFYLFQVHPKGNKPNRLGIRRKTNLLNISFPVMWRGCVYFSCDVSRSFEYFLQCFFRAFFWTSILNSAAASDGCSIITLRRRDQARRSCLSKLKNLPALKKKNRSQALRAPASACTSMLHRTARVRARATGGKLQGCSRRLALVTTSVPVVLFSFSFSRINSCTTVPFVW